MSRMGERGINTANMIHCKADEMAVANGCYFDPDAAERVREFFARFVRVRTKNGPQPFELLPWQWEYIVLPLFGWRRADGKRRFREAYISMGKKNGRDHLAAALLLYMLVVEIGPEQEAYSFATEREQASVVYREAARMVRASPNSERSSPRTAPPKPLPLRSTDRFSAA